MKTTIRKFTAWIVAAVMVLSLAACSKSEGNNSQSESVEGEYVWVPSYENLELPENGWISNVKMEEGILYYCVDEWDEETMTSVNSICKKELAKDAEAETLYRKENAEGTDESLSSFCVLPEGKLALILTQYTEQGNNWMLQIVDAQGNTTAETDITAAVNDGTDWAYINVCTNDAEGNLYLQCEQKVLVYDENGNHLFDVNAKENWIQAMGNAKDGTVLVLQYAGSGINLSTIDVAKKDYGTSYQNLPEVGNGMVMPGIDKDVLLSTRSGLAEYDFATQSYEEILNWLDSDINPDYIEGVSSTEEGKIVALIREWGSNNEIYQICTLTQTLKSEVPQKKVITLGTMGLSQGIQNQIINFNKTNSEYRINVIDYAKDLDYSQENAYQDAQVRFQNDILTGNAPDIIDMTDSNLEQLMSKGVIEDLSSYLESSKTVKREDFIPSILEVYTIDGKLACIPSTFQITTMAAKKADVGDKTGWTVADLIALTDSKPADVEIMRYASKENVLQICLTFDEESFIDWSSGKCNFDSEEFRNVLEFANRFPAEYNWEAAEGVSEAELIAQGKLLMMSINISEFTDVQLYNAMYGKDIVYIGFPTSSGENGSAIYGQDILGISSQSQNKEGAWAFLETLLTEDYQTGMFSWGLPTLQSAYDSKLAEAMEKYYELDAEGNQVLDEEGNPIEMSKGGMTYNDFSVEFYAVTQEEAEQLEELIANTKKAIRFGSASEVYSIIEEEVAPYFAGQKSLEEVVDIIQNRVQIYISENM